MKRARGFTLVEVLVALLIMAIMAALAWRGMDGILRSRDVAQAGTERMLQLQSVLAQWEADLTASIETDSQGAGVPASFQFDGKSLTLTRRTAGGMQIVVWALHGQSWQRWTSAVSTRPDDLQDQWLRAQQLVGNEPGQLHTLAGVSQWQLYFYRRNAWSNAQSSADAPAEGMGVQQVDAQDQGARPKAVRLDLAFAEGSGWNGTLRRDLILPPK